ncbi:MAG: tRNA (adenosine(37)-N6)-dimethylallyltransferase MiaA, partial [Candidatus Jacksonbacteria bacterium]
MKPQNSQQKLIVILGPTSSGKTGLAQKLCLKFNGFIISADSRQVYRYMDIGTGKVDSLDELKELRNQRQNLFRKHLTDPLDYVIKLNDVNHYMIDVIDPNEDYNAALYQRDVYNLISNFKFLINSKYKILNTKYQIPFLVGGTGLYIDAVADNWQFPKGEPNLELREQIERQIETDGLESVWTKLTIVDPESKTFVQKENPRRVARALEYVLSTGQKFSENRGKGRRQFDVLKIGIDLAREELYKKIDARVGAWLEMGLIDEVRLLHKKHGLSWERLRNFGLDYQVAADYLQGKFKSMDAMLNRFKWNMHAYARRQMTWFRRDREIKWVSGLKEAEGLVR